MISFPRLVGFSLALLLVLVAAALAAQAWITRQEIRIEAAAVERARGQLATLIELTGGPDAPWHDERLARIGAALGARVQRVAGGATRVDLTPASTARDRLRFTLALPGEPADALQVSLPAPPTDRILLLFQRVLLALGVFAVVLLVTLIAATILGKPGADKTAEPSALAPDLRSLAHLARHNVAQEEKLAAERESRLRAQEAAHLRLNLLNRALEEKINLGRDLHDGIIQSLYATGLTVESAREILPQDPARTADQLDQAMRMINQAIADTRAYIKGLAPARVRRDSLAGAIQSLLDDQRGGRPVDFTVEVDEAAPPALNDDQLADLFQIVREGASNALRHGDASRIEVSLRRLPSGGLELLLADNGRGFDAHVTPSAHHHGLANLTARAQAGGGHLAISSDPAQGTRLQVIWPAALAPSTTHAAS